MSNLKNLFRAANTISSSTFLSTVTRLKNKKTKMEFEQPFIYFNNGKRCPQLGLGTYKLDNASEVIKQAINIGYRHFDCAHVYKNEIEVGKGLKEKMRLGIVSREDLFITSKLWNTNHQKELVMPALSQSLSRLGLRYLDLYLIHWPMGFKEGEEFYPLNETGKVQYSNTYFLETWSRMEECVQLGLTKSIGVSNFNSKQIQDILKYCKIRPVINQIECHPYLNQSKLIEFCHSNSINVTAYSPLGSPARPLPSDDLSRVLEDKRVEKIAEKYIKTPGQILIRYQLDRGIIVIPKSGDLNRLQLNFESLNFKLDSEDMKILNNMQHPNGRMIPFTELQDHKDYPFSIEF